jgi:hypothetical protein
VAAAIHAITTSPAPWKSMHGGGVFETTGKKPAERRTAPTS